MPWERGRSERTRIANCANRAAFAFGFALTLASCEMPWMTASEDIEKSGAFVKAAVDDARTAARRAVIFDEANVWNRAEKEVDEVEVILRKARDERARIRKAHRAAIAALAGLRPSAGINEAGRSSIENDRRPPRDQGPNSNAAADSVARIGSVLSAADGGVAAIEQTFVALRDLEIPRRR